MIYKVLNSEGGLLRSGMCQAADLELQAGPGETVSESSESEIAELTQSLAAESGAVQELPTEQPASPPLPPLDNWTVLIRAIQNAGVAIDIEAARTELAAEIVTKRAESTAAKAAESRARSL